MKTKMPSTTTSTTNAIPSKNSTTDNGTTSTANSNSSGHRQIAWTALFLFSVVALASQLSLTANRSRERADRFVVAVCTISGGLALISVLSYAAVKRYYKGSAVEGLLCVLALLDWICGMPFIMNPDRNIAVSKGVTTSGTTGPNNVMIVTSDNNIVAANTDSSTIDEGRVTRVEFTFIRNANMYFASWACTICVVYLCGRFAREYLLERRRRRQQSAATAAAAAASERQKSSSANSNNNDNNDKNKKKKTSIKQNMFAPKTNLWYLLTMASLVVLVDATELYRSFTCPAETSQQQQEQQQFQLDLCTSTEYAVALGAMGTFFAFICASLATLGGLTVGLELFVGLLMCAAYLAGVGLVTFNNGPGTSLGNLYFVTWMGAVVSFILFGRAWRDMIHGCRNKQQPEEEDEDDEPEPQPPVEFPDVEMGDPYNKEDPAWAIKDSSPAIAAIMDNSDDNNNNNKDDAEEQAADTSVDEVEVEYKPDVPNEDKKETPEETEETDDTAEKKASDKSSKEDKPEEEIHVKPETESEVKDEKPEPASSEQSATKSKGSKGGAVAATKKSDGTEATSNKRPSKTQKSPASKQAVAKSEAKPKTATKPVKSNKTEAKSAVPEKDSTNPFDDSEKESVVPQKNPTNPFADDEKEVDEERESEGNKQDDQETDTKEGSPESTKGEEGKETSKEKTSTNENSTRKETTGKRKSKARKKASTDDKKNVTEKSKDGESASEETSEAVSTTEEKTANAKEKESS